MAPFSPHIGLQVLTSPNRLGRWLQTGSPTAAPVFFGRDAGGHGQGPTGRHFPQRAQDARHAGGAPGVLDGSMKEGMIG